MSKEFFMDKPSLPKDPIKIEKTRNLIFISAITIMIGLSIFFLWKAFTIKPGVSEEKTESTNQTQGEEKKIGEKEEQGTSTYEVQVGDTLWGISKKFGVTLDDLFKANNLKENDILQVGQILIIPEGEGEINTEEIVP